MAFPGCGNSTGPAVQLDSVFYSNKVQGWLRQTVPSVVGVSTIFIYDVETFNHQLVNGVFVSDPTSPSGYLLAGGDSARVILSDQRERVNGVGLIIYRDEFKAAVLTNAHLITREDTALTYFRNSEGELTNVLYSRATRRSTSNYVIGQVEQFIQAEVLSADEKTDLGLLLVTSSPALGIEYSFGVSPPQSLKWADFAYVFGNPRETKQLTSGIISPLSQRGFFIIDAVARSGFSGGPVLVVRPDKGLELAGIISGVPSEKLFYVAPPVNYIPGQKLSPSDRDQFYAEEADLIQYGTAYAIGTQLIFEFLDQAAGELYRKGISLSSKYSFK